MENISPTLLLLLSLRWKMEAGESLRSALKGFIQSEGASEIGRQAKSLLDQFDNKVVNHQDFMSIRSPYRRALFEVLRRGLEGQPIFPTLEAMEQEIVEACYSELEEFVSRLPFLLLVPVTLFIFPSLIVLLLSPLIVELAATI